MDCTATQERLSAYLDGELPTDERDSVAQHLANCPVCAAELAGFERLSELAGELSPLEPPAEVWTRVEQDLHQAGETSPQAAQSVVQPRSTQSGLSKSVPRILALAVSALAMVGATWFGITTWFVDDDHGDHTEFTQEFGEYLETFHRDPAAAQEFLLAKYKGQRTEPKDAVQLVGYRPVVARGLPSEYSIKSMYVMKMPCCTCVQCLCIREDGTTIVVFEHDDDETKEWFGDRPETKKKFNGKQCSLVQLDEGLAATWKCNGRHITVVGIRDDDESSRLVDWFADQDSMDQDSIDRSKNLQ